MSDPTFNPFASPGKGREASAEANSVLRDAPSATSELATIELVPAEYRGRLYNRWFLIPAIGLAMLPIALALLAIMGTPVFFLPYAIDPNIHWVVRLAVILTPVVGATGLLVYRRYFAEHVVAWAYYWRFCPRISKRPQPMVHPDEPGHLLAGIVPRENMAQSRFVKSRDLGLIVFDDQRREIRFEGDINRLRIPCGSLLACEAECFHHERARRREFWFLRLAANTIDGAEEIILSVSQMDPFESKSNRHHKERAEEFVQRVHDWQDEIDLEAVRRG